MKSQSVKKHIRIIIPQYVLFDLPSAWNWKTENKGRRFESNFLDVILTRHL